MINSSATDRPAPPPRRPERYCDCPCHTGTDIFHIVPCCGSLLGSLVPRVAAQAESPPEP